MKRIDTSVSSTDYLGFLRRIAHGAKSAAWSRVTNCSYTFTEQGCCTGHLEQNLTHFWRNTRSKVRGTFRPLTRSTATIPTDCMLAPTNFAVTVFPSRKSND